jgi:hypothetical protein
MGAKFNPSVCFAALLARQHALGPRQQQLMQQ